MSWSAQLKSHHACSNLQPLRSHPSYTRFAYTDVGLVNGMINFVTRKHCDAMAWHIYRMIFGHIYTHHQDKGAHSIKT